MLTPACMIFPGRYRRESILSHNDRVCIYTQNPPKLVMQHIRRKRMASPETVFSWHIPFESSIVPISNTAAEVGTSHRIHRSRNSNHVRNNTTHPQISPMDLTLSASVLGSDNCDEPVVDTSVESPPGIRMQQIVADKI